MFSKLLNNLIFRRKSILNIKQQCFSEGKFHEEFHRACSQVCEIIPQVKGPKPSLISIYSEKPKPTLCLEEIASTLKIPQNVIACCASDVGPGASKQGIYKNPEYFCYHRMSFYEAMNNLRCSRVSNSPQLDVCHMCESLKK